MRPTGTLRRTGTVARVGLVAVAVAVLAACGGGGSPSATTSAPPRTSSAAAPMTPAGPTGANAVFCQQVGQLVAELATVQSAPPEQVPAMLTQLIKNFDGVHPPAAIQTDWQALGTGLRQLQAAVASVDVTTSEGQAQLKQLETQATAAAATPQGDISAWVLSNCGSGGSATSSSAAGSP
jgi:hypothetical protein